MGRDGLESLPASSMGRLCRVWLGSRVNPTGGVLELGRRHGVSSAPGHL